LGELNKEGFNKDTLKSDLYVNLRCMKIIKIRHLYMGCGITKDSNPRKEWEERQQIDDYEKGVVGT
jgi:isochorismate synthase